MNGERVESLHSHHHRKRERCDDQGGEAPIYQRQREGPPSAELEAARRNVLVSPREAQPSIDPREEPASGARHEHGKAEAGTACVRRTAPERREEGRANTFLWH